MWATHSRDRNPRGGAPARRVRYDQPHAVIDVFDEERQPVQESGPRCSRGRRGSRGRHVRPLDPADQRAGESASGAGTVSSVSSSGRCGQHRVQGGEVPPERVSTCIELGDGYKRGRGRGVVSSVERLPEGGRFSIAGRRVHRRDPGHGVEAAVDLAAKNRRFVDGAPGRDMNHVGRARVAPSVAPKCAVTVTLGTGTDRDAESNHTMKNASHVTRTITVYGTINEMIVPRPASLQIALGDEHDER